MLGGPPGALLAGRLQLVGDDLIPTAVQSQPGAHPPERTEQFFDHRLQAVPTSHSLRWQRHRHSPAAEGFSRASARHLSGMLQARQAPKGAPDNVRGCHLPVQLLLWALPEAVVVRLDDVVRILLLLVLVFIPALIVIELGVLVLVLSTRAPFSARRI